MSRSARLSLWQAAGENLAVENLVARNFHFDQFRERVHHRNTHAVKAAGGFIGLVRELAARVERGHDDLQRRFLGEFRVRVDRDAASIVDDRQEAFGIKVDLDPVCMAGDSLVHRVIEHFGEQVMIGALVGAADIHAGPFADRFKALKNFNIFGRIAGRIWYHSVEQLCLIGGGHNWSPLKGVRLSVDIGRT